MVGGLRTLVPVCTLASQYTVCPQVHVRSSLLPPPPSSQSPRAAFPLISLTCPHPHCFCLSLPPQLDLPPQAVPHKQPKGAKIRFNVADKVLPAVAPLISPCVPPRTLLFTLVQILSLSLFYLIYLFFGCFNLPPTCTTQPPDVLVHLPSAQPH